MPFGVWVRFGSRNYFETLKVLNGMNDMMLVLQHSTHRQECHMALWTSLVEFHLVRRQ